MPASSAAWIVAMLSARSAGPYMPDMPMQPRPRAETSGPVDPSLRLTMASQHTLPPAVVAGDVGGGDGRRDASARHCLARVALDVPSEQQLMRVQYVDEALDGVLR